ncbi:MAG TPA: L-threonate dehydrogenase [Acetobacteraceae bacterium]|nr:L-threonate dehydrogenase [Acetobacteraceae bacterium]
MKVGVIGLGTMGLGAARNLVAKGHEVTGCDLRSEPRAALEAAGGRTVGRPRELPDDLEAVLTLVVTADQERSVLLGPEGCAPRLPQGAVVICSATIPPDAARALETDLTEAGLLMLDAPVSGGQAGAESGTMTVMASGSDAAFARAEPVLAAIAGKVFRLGDRAGIGSTVKMVNQLLAGVHIAAAAEAMALGIRAGADPQTLYDVITVSAGNSWMFQNRVPHILAGDDRPLSAASIFIKDLGIVLDQGRALNFPLPLASVAHQLFLATAAAGYGGRDDSSVIRFWEALAGIELPKKG